MNTFLIILYKLHIFAAYNTGSGTDEIWEAVGILKWFNATQFIKNCLKIAFR